MNRIKEILSIVMAIVVILTIPIGNNTEFDNLEAEKVLRDTYGPLEEFTKDLCVSEDEKFLIVPNYINSEDDFLKLFNGKIAEHNIKGFYDDLFVEKDGTMFIDGTIYIPNIYGEETRVSKAYIKIRESLISRIFKSKISHGEDKQLIIKEECKVWTSSWERRTNYFNENESGQWILDHGNGTSKVGFIDVAENPWKKNWKTKDK